MSTDGSFRSASPGTTDRSAISYLSESRDDLPLQDRARAAGRSRGRRFLTEYSRPLLQAAGRRRARLLLVVVLAQTCGINRIVAELPAHDVHGARDRAVALRLERRALLLEE